MDPLSIAASVGGLTTACLTIGLKLNDVASKFSDSSQIISALYSETRIISFSLSKLQSLLLGTDAAPSQALLQPDVLAALDVSVTGCAVTLSCLDDELRNLVPKLEKNQGLGFVDKAGFVFKDQKLKDLSNQLRGQCGGITFLLTCLQM
tara:strand:+ start:149 stop:595 length:447 start_codon:yes stop_codon:yes gene_type:complete